MRTKKFTDLELIQLHKKKLNDRQIGDLFGVGRGTIFRRRRKLYLIANIRPKLIDDTDFYLSNKTGKECRKEYHQSDKFKEYIKKYHQSDKFKEYQKKYHQKNREKIKKYYQKNREKILENKKKDYQSRKGRS